MNAFSINKRVACAPFETSAVQKTVAGKSGGFIMAKHTKELTKLKVLFDFHDLDPQFHIYAGAEVYVRGDQAGAAWAREVVVIDDTEFIMVPLSSIILVSYESFYKPQDVTDDRGLYFGN